MADMLATPADLASLLGLELVDLDAPRATLLLECATAVIQAKVGQRIIEVVGDAVVLDLDGTDRGQYLVLPERPATAVASVAVGALPVSDYLLSRNRLWRASGWRSTLVAYPAQPSTVAVTYTHGYPAGHQRLQLGRSAALSMARGSYDNTAGATSEKIDDYAVTFEAMSVQLEASPFLLDALRRQYGRPLGSVRLITTGSTRLG